MHGQEYPGGDRAPLNLVHAWPAVHTGLSSHSSDLQSSLPVFHFYSVLPTLSFTATELRCGELIPIKTTGFLMEQSQLWSNLPLNLQEYKTEPGTELTP